MARTKGSDSKLTELRIRKVALNLFSQHGYSAVSMRKIASKADLQVGALYLYTPNKQSLLFDLLKTHMDSLLKNWVVENIEAAPDKRLKSKVCLLGVYKYNAPTWRSALDAIFLIETAA